ncbi:MAG: aminotransferase class III-fold pyridoxal phosphate-dependent enzyme, partial [Bacteroidales bacterium]|nr:aminotransferase class III-fold pyridoxal phosphate-dependent enzyme [Bacteroidales bacterium]
MMHILHLIDNGNVDIVRSEGCYLYDSDGNQYTDMESGVWCVNLGHNHKRINRVIRRQLDQTIHLGYQVKSELPDQLSQILLDKLRLYGGKSVFLNSGSEAVDLAISIAMHLTGRKKVCKIDGSYLG